VQIENERLELQYRLLKDVYGGKLYFAPIHEPKKILDIGTGTGTWCLETGKYPSKLLSLPVFVMVGLNENA